MMSMMGFLLATTIFIPATNATAKIGALVLDGDTLEPMSAVSVLCRFRRWPDGKYDEQVRPTDRYGRTSFCGVTGYGQVEVRIAETPKGYHNPTTWRVQTWARCNDQDVFQPENLVTTQYLSKIVNPIPLFACEKQSCNSFVGEFEENDNILRFDLMKGDWLPPDGVGETADVIFRRFPLQRDVNGRWKSQEVAVEFPGEGNGVRVIRNPSRGAAHLRIAPEDGYRPTYRMWAQLGGACNWTREPVLAFRIRTKLDAKGQIAECYYGKIYDGFQMVDEYNPKGVRSVRICYYLNPTSLDRNLEWDCKTNLCRTPGSFRRNTPRP